jgi:hypothetical protein
MSSNQPMETKGCQGHPTRNPCLEEAIEVKNISMRKKFVEDFVF